MKHVALPINGSFRDPANRVYEHEGRILRGVTSAALENFKALEQSSFFKDYVARGLIVRTTLADLGDEAAKGILAQGWAGVLAHERVPLISYPYEWTFSMLKDAALLQLDLLESGLKEGWTIKDSTPFNIQFVGAKPVFIDIPSFEPREQGEHWAAYRQFCMLFLYPLMLKAHLGLDFQPVLRSNLDGISPGEAARYFKGLKRFKKGVTSHISIPAMIEGRVENSEKDRAPAKKRDSLKQSDAMVLGLVQSMKRLVQSLESPIRHTEWSEYANTHSYEQQAFEAKLAFVRNAAKTGHWGVAWDIGGNTGTFSKICAEYSDRVITVDGDHDAVEKLYLSEKGNDAGKILPLYMNLANPSPNQGWAGTERLGFTDRNSPDFVVCLALIHHISLSANVPIPLFLEWLRSLNAKLVIEFVDRPDEMVQKLLLNKKEKYPDYNKDVFERELNARFKILDSQDLKGGHRKIYFCEPK